MSLTFEEICSQPHRWAATISAMVYERSRWEELFRTNSYETLYFTGCGTSYYLADTAARLFQEKTGIDSRALPASEIMLTAEYVIPKRRNSLLIALSRSGSTTETVKAIEAFSKGGFGDTLSICCRRGSPASSSSKYSIELDHTFDNSVVMTSTFTNMLLATQLLAAIVSNDAEYLEELERLPEIGESLQEKTTMLAASFGSDLKRKQFIYLGFGSYFGLSAEAMIKLKEMTQVPTESYNPLEFRHGPISIVEEDTVAVLLLNDKNSRLQLEVLEDVKKLGGKTLLISEQPLDAPYVDAQLTLESGLGDAARAVLYMPFVQSIGFFRAIALGLNPDRPRFLNQVTTIKI